MDTRKNTTVYRKRLSSLTSHLRKYERPFTDGYNVYATTFIAGDIPWKRILPEEEECSDLPPFTPKYEIEHYTLQQEERKLRGESIRNQDLIPSAKIIHDHIKEAEDFEGRGGNLHLAYLYFKAMQYSEVNKALALNEKYPKPEENRIRKTYSKEHQAAIAELLIEKELRKCEGAPLLQKERQLVEIPKLTCGSKETRTVARTESELEELSQIRWMIKEALGMPPLMKSSAKILQEPWQFKVKSDRPRIKQPKKNKLNWKRNTYPPKTREEKIADLRKLAPPLLPEHLETDELPGTWKPELMIDSFQTLYMEKQEEKEKVTEKEDSWLRLFESNKKCRDWLISIPETL